jgi:hypothetical protein
MHLFLPLKYLIHPAETGIGKSESGDDETHTVRASIIINNETMHGMR